MTRRLRQVVFTVIAFFFLVAIAFAGSTTTSSKTAQDIIDDVRVDLNESTAVFWADSELVTWIDEAIWEITSKTRCLEETVFTISLVANTYSYTISTNFVDVETVLHDSGDNDDPTRIMALKREDITDFGHEREHGRPKKYCIWDNKLLVWPVPDSTWAGTDLYLYVVSFPAGVSGTGSSIETPAYFDTAIKYYVLAKAYYKDNKEVRGNYYMSLFEKMLQDYINTVIRRNYKQP